MSRTPLTYEHVTEIIQKIITTGERPTINRIREALDNQGSVPLVARYLKQWREANGQQLPLDIVQEMPIQTERQPVQTQREIMVDAEEQQPASLPLPTVESVMTQTQSEPSATPFQPPIVEEERDHSSPRQPHQNREGQHPRPQHQQRQHNNKDGQHPRQQRRNFDQQQPLEPPQPKVVDFNKPYPTMPQDVQEFLDQPIVEPERLDSNSLEALVALTKEALITRVRYLSSLASKEQTRANVHERIARDANVYSESIKNMVSERINATRDGMQATIDQLKLQLSQHKAQAEKELLRYQQQLDVANRKLVELLPPVI